MLITKIIKLYYNSKVQTSPNKENNISSNINHTTIHSDSNLNCCLSNEKPIKLSSKKTESHASSYEENNVYINGLRIYESNEKNQKYGKTVFTFNDLEKGPGSNNSDNVKYLYTQLKNQYTGKNISSSKTANKRDFNDKNGMLELKPILIKNNVKKTDPKKKVRFFVDSKDQKTSKNFNIYLFRGTLSCKAKYFDLPRVQKLNSSIKVDQLQSSIPHFLSNTHKFSSIQPKNALLKKETYFFVLITMRNNLETTGKLEEIKSIVQTNPSKTNETANSNVSIINEAVSQNTMQTTCWSGTKATKEILGVINGNQQIKSKNILSSKDTFNTLKQQDNKNDSKKMGSCKVTKF